MRFSRWVWCALCGESKIEANDMVSLGGALVICARCMKELREMIAERRAARARGGEST